jgi:hypothetical protein
VCEAVLGAICRQGWMTVLVGISGPGGMSLLGDEWATWDE